MCEVAVVTGVALPSCVKTDSERGHRPCMRSRREAPALARSRGRVSPPQMGSGHGASAGPALGPGVVSPTVAALGSLLTVFGCSNSLQGGPASHPASHSASLPMGRWTANQTLAGVQYLYAQDMVARVNAERAIRSNGARPFLSLVSILPCKRRLRSGRLIGFYGDVADPSLSSCNGSPNQVCAFAADSGSSGYGFWPGDGSDGTETTSWPRWPTARTNSVRPTTTSGWASPAPATKHGRLRFRLFAGTRVVRCQSPVGTAGRARTRWPRRRQWRPHRRVTRCTAPGRPTDLMAK